MQSIAINFQKTNILDNRLLEHTIIITTRSAIRLDRRLDQRLD